MQRTVLLWIAGLVCLAAAWLTVHGLVQMKWSGNLPLNTMAAATGYTSFLFGSALIVALGARLAKRRPLAITVLLGLLITVFANGLWPLIAVFILALSSIALGDAVMSHFGMVEEQRNMTSKLLVGAGFYATLVSLAAHFPINYSSYYLLVLLIPILFGRRNLSNEMRYAAKKLTAPLDYPGQIDWVEVMLGTIALLHFAFTFLPEVMYDALAQHLFVASQMGLRHQWGFDPSLYVLALVPMLGDWSFSLGYVLADETGARLINVGFIFLVAFLGRTLTLWMGGSEKGANWAMLLFLATPLTFTESSSLFVESVWAAYLIAGLMYLLMAVAGRESSASRFILSGMMLGFAVATKELTLIYLPALLLPLLWRWNNFFVKRSIAPAIKGLLLFIALGSIPYVVAYWISGNPVFPYFNALFKSSFFAPVDFDNTLFKSGVGFDLLYKIVFSSEKYLEASAGVSGFQWLLLLPPAVVLLFLPGNKQGWLLLTVSCISLIIVFHFQSYLRYIFPVLLFVSALIGLVLSKVRLHGRYFELGISAIVSATLILNMVFFSSGVWVYRDVPVMQVFKPEERDVFISSRMPLRSAIELVNLLNTEHRPVAFLSAPFGAGLNADALYGVWYNQSFIHALMAASDPPSIARAIAERHAQYVIIDPNWATAARRSMAIDATEPVATIGPINIRRLKDEFRFTRELLKNPNILGTVGWELLPGAVHPADGDTLIVTVSSPAVQSVPVQAGGVYMNEVHSRCRDPFAQVRVQVNWLDARAEFISASLQSFDCTPEWSAKRQEVIAPPLAVSAVVYAAAHTEKKVEIDSVSFKQE